MIWSNGEILAPEALRIDVLDRSFQHGLGLFETLRTWNGHPMLLDRNLERMRRSASELGLCVHGDPWPDHRAVLNLIAASQIDGDARIRITMSGGRDGPGSKANSSVIWMTIAPLATPAGSRAAVIDRTIQVTTDDPLARYKTLNYWRKRIDWDRAVEEGADEVLCVTPEGLVREGTRTNLFVAQGPALITPSTDGPLLPGIMRRVVLDHAARLGLEVVEGEVSWESLKTVGEAFLTNSIAGIRPIARLFGRELPAPGPIARRVWDEVRPWLESGGTRS